MWQAVLVVLVALLVLPVAPAVPVVLVVPVGQAGGRFGCLLRGGGHTENKKRKKKVVPLGLVAPPVLALVIARMFLITSDYQHERLLPEFARNRWTSVDC